MKSHKNNILASVLAFFIFCCMYPQGNTSNLKSGDIFIIGNVKNNNYQYINFPKTNFIIKKGGLANYKNIIGKKVMVTYLIKKSNGNRIATLKLFNSRRFFNSHKYVTVDIDKAIENKELLIVVD